MSGYRSVLLFSTVCVFLLSGYAGAQPAEAPIWPMAGRDLANSNSIPWQPPTTGEMAWSAALGQGGPIPLTPHGSPVVGADGTIYVASTGGTLCSVASDGAAGWTTKLTDRPPSSPAIASDGTIYIVAGAGEPEAEPGDLITVSPAGQTLRHRVIPACKADPVVLPDGRIYLACLSQLLVLDSAGNEVWSFPFEGLCLGRPALDENHTAYFGTTAGLLYAVSAEGKEVWRVETGGAIEVAPCLGPDDLVYVATCGANRELGNGDIRAYDLSGNEVWKYHAIGRPFAAPAVGLRGPVLYTGCTSWHTPGGYASVRASRPSAPNEGTGLSYGSRTPTMRPVTSAPGVYFEGQEGILERSGHAWRGLFADAGPLDGNALGAAAAPDGTLYVVTDKGMLCAFRDPRGEGPLLARCATDETWEVVRALLLAPDEESFSAAIDTLMELGDAAIPALDVVSGIEYRYRDNETLRAKAERARADLEHRYQSWLRPRTAPGPTAWAPDIPPMAWLADRDDAVVRYAATHAPDCPERTAALATLLRSNPDAEARGTAADRLGDTACLTTEAVDALVDAVRDPNEDLSVRLTCVRALLRGPAVDLAYRQSIVSALESVAADTATNGWVRAEAGLALDRLDAAPAGLLETFLAWAGHDDARVRVAALEILGGYEADRDRVIPVLLTATESENGAEATAAIGALVEIGASSGIVAPPVLRIASAPGNPAYDRALEYLPRSGVPAGEGVPLLCQALAAIRTREEGADRNVAYGNVLGAIAEYGAAAEPALPYLTDLWNSDQRDEWTTSYLVEAFGAIGAAPDDVVAALEGVLTDGTHGARREALDALLAIGLPGDRVAGVFQRVADSGSTALRGGSYFGDLANRGSDGIPALRVLAATSDRFTSGQAKRLLTAMGEEVE